MSITQGAASDRGNGPSSFAVLDALVAELTRQWPSLRTVTLAGFSVSAAPMGMLLLVVIAIGVSLVALLLVVRTRRQTA